MSEWKKVRLGELYVVHNGLSKPRDAFGSGFPFLSYSTVFNNFFLPRSLDSLVQTTEKEQEAYSIKAGDVFITRTSETADELGMSSVALYDYPNATYNGFCKRLRPITDRVYPRYVGYFLRTPVFRSHFNALSGSMTTRASLKNEDLLAMEIALPPLPTQHKIAAVLGALDDKIENNRKICANLEAQAQAIFKSWFVDFEPFGGKMPQEWKILPLESVCFNIRDRVGSEGAKERKVLSAIADGKLVLSEDYFTKQVYSKEIGKYIIVNEGDFAYNPARINIGSIGINDLGVSGCVSPVYVSIRVDKEYRNFFKLFFKTPYFAEEVSRRAIGSVRQLLSYTDFAMISCVYPAREYIQKFNQIYEVIVSGQRTAERESRMLAATRDALLPKLMSGEIDVEKVKVA